MNRKSIEVLCVALIASSSSQAATFTGLGSLSNSEFYSTAAAVSADGSTVIGTTTSLSGSEGFYWASNISMTGIGMMSAVPDDLYTQAIAVSGDGSFIVGKAQNNDNLSFLFNEFNEPTGFSLPSKVSAFVYSMNGEYQDLGKLVEPTPVSLDPVCPVKGDRNFPCYVQYLFPDTNIAKAISYDGSVIVGTSANQAFRWQQSTGMLEIGIDSATSISADGTIIAGSSYANYTVVNEPVVYDWTNLRPPFAPNNQNFQPTSIITVSEAVYWTEESGMIKLSNSNDSASAKSDYVRSFASAISDNGLVIIGQYDNNAFRWTKETGMESLGTIAPAYNSTARDINADGSIIVGSNTVFGNITNHSYNLLSLSFTHEEAFIWDPVNQMRNLKDVLENTYGLDLTGWLLEEATGISADGSVIVGMGINPAGFREAWMVSTSRASINGCRRVISQTGKTRTVGYCGRAVSKISSQNKKNIN